MKNLFLAITIAFSPALALPAAGMTCQQVREVAETVLDAPNLTSEQQYFILEGLFGGYYGGCAEYIEDAQD